MKKTKPGSPVEPILCLAHRIEAIANKYVFQPMGFSAISMQILKLLKNNGPLTASDLIKSTGASKSNMSQRLSFLEKEKLVSKLGCESCRDKRKTTIKITPAGRKKVSDLEKRFKKAQISFEKKFSEKELTQHKAFFQKLNALLDNGEDELEKIFKF